MTLDRVSVSSDHPEPDQIFHPGERLFRRISAAHVVNGVVTDAAVRLGFPPACSFNREKYSAPEDVLLGTHPTLNGIVCAQVRDVEFAETTEGNVCWETFVLHAPEAGNYAHTEVRLKRQGERYNSNATPNSKVFRKLIRSRLASRLTILRDPV